MEMEHHGRWRNTRCRRIVERVKGMVPVTYGGGCSYARVSVRKHCVTNDGNEQIIGSRIVHQYERA